MSQLYFAYGSNMLSSRLAKRKVEAVSLGRAVLENQQLVFNKPSIDQSGKANIIDSPHHKVWGVLYQVPAETWLQLDQFEGGYQRESCTVISHQHGSCQGVLYRWYGADCLTPPYDWYMDLLIAGAREHGFPEHYLDFLHTIPTISQASSNQ